MASTDHTRVGPGLNQAPRIQPLLLDELEHQPQAVLALSEAAHWNQLAADWRLMLALGQGYAIWADDAGGQRRLAASAVVLPYGERFAWISMVLVLPDFRRRGYATRLLRHALDELNARGVMAVLDATPAGLALYRRLGFVDAWGFGRFRRESPAMAAKGCAVAAGIRPLQDSDWPAIDMMDSPVFGASRLPVLRDLAQRLPGAAWVAQEKGRLCGLVLGRDGREAVQIGPLLARDEGMAKTLLTTALSTINGPVMVDLLDREMALREWLLGQGFVLQRPFTRMVHGTGATAIAGAIAIASASAAPGSAEGLVLVAGPELG